MTSQHRITGYCVRVPLCDASVASEYFSVKSYDVQSNVVQHKIVLRVRLPCSYLMMLYIYCINIFSTVYSLFCRIDIPTPFSSLEGGLCPRKKKNPNDYIDFVSSILSKYVHPSSRDAKDTHVFAIPFFKSAKLKETGSIADGNYFPVSVYAPKPFPNFSTDKIFVTFKKFRHFCLSKFCPIRYLEVQVFITCLGQNIHISDVQLSALIKFLVNSLAYSRKILVYLRKIKTVFES